MMMNIQVFLKTAEKGVTTSKIEVSVNSKETVTSVKDKVAASQLIAFPEHSLMLDGKKMDGAKTMEDYSVKESASLDFVLEATEESVVHQLSELLKARDLTSDELGLLYCYKYGVSTNQALKTVGIEMKLLDFLKDKEAFTLTGSKVSLSAKTEKPKTEKPKAEKLKAVEKPKVEQVKVLEKPKGLNTNAAAFQPKARAEPAPIEKSEEQYQQLHEKISSRSFNSRIAQALSTVKEIVEEKSFLNVVDVAKGGSIAKGTAIEGCADAELVFFLKGLPEEGHATWLAPLLKSVKAVLEMNLPADVVEELQVTADSVRMIVKGGVTLDLRFSPAFSSYAATVQALGAQGPNSRFHFTPALVKERTQFVAKQPGHVKVTIRLLKWWCNQQAFSCSLTRPSDYILELVAIYASQQCGKTAQAQMIANCMSLLAKFDRLRVMWPTHYDNSDAWAPLLLQKPLVMDPVNPFVNCADPQDFDARELMRFASSTHFFW